MVAVSNDVGEASLLQTAMMWEGLVSWLQTAMIWGASQLVADSNVWEGLVCRQQ